MTATKAEKELNAIMAKPLQRNAGLQIGINRFFTDINGTIISKTDPSVIAAGMDIEFPIWMFGQFDRDGGYRVGNQITPPLKLSTGTGLAQYLGTFIAGLDLPFLFATGINTVRHTMALGDIAHVFTDSLDIPTVYCFIIQSGKSAALASIMGNAIASENEKIYVKGLNYFFASEANLQFIRNMNVTRIDHVGSFENFPTNILGSVQVFDKQAFAYFPIKFTVDQYNLLSTYIPIEIDTLQFSFIINKNTKLISSN
jgi:hypothetical protein